MSEKLRILIVVTHLLGVGHLARMAVLGRALAARGHRVRLVTGGRPAPIVKLAGLEVVQLPSVHCRGTDFATLLDETGAVASPAMLAERVAMLRAACRDLCPQVVITELYPFGRRNLSAEFDALLEEAEALEPRPAILASIRDVLNPPSKPGRAESVLARLAARYDRVLVHGEAEIIPLAASWPVTPPLARRLADTGYLHDGAAAAPASIATREGILVSGGGSAASLPLFHAAIAAAKLLPAQAWRLLVGHGMPQADFAGLATDAPANMVVERARADFPALLGRAALSISQAGYNTVLDLAAAGPRALLVPFAEGQEREQGLRAEALAARGLAHVLAADRLDGATLAEAAESALAGPEPDWRGFRLDGAARAVAIVEQEAAGAARRAMAWARLDAALRQAERTGTTLPFWLRDDDAIAPTPELERFLALLDRWGLPLAIATIPAGMTADLVARCRVRPGTALLVHGHSHANHAPAGAKKAEFGPHRPLEAMEAELGHALAKARACAGDLLLPVLVPPWNRIAPDLVARLGALGFAGISTFAAPKPGETPPGLIRRNTHWDPIAWHAGGGLRDEATLIDDLALLIEGRVAAAAGAVAEPIGLLTHHLVQDGWVERHLATMLARLVASPAVTWPPIASVFAP